MHIKQYAESQNVYLEEKEVLEIYNFIQKKYLNLLEDDTTIYELKPLVREDLYQKILILYKEAKDKYL